MLPLTIVGKLKILVWAKRLKFFEGILGMNDKRVGTTNSLFRKNAVDGAFFLLHHEVHVEDYFTITQPLEFFQHSPKRQTLNGDRPLDDDFVWIE